MLTYLNDAKLKADLLVEIGKHEAADQIIKGSYGTTRDGIFKACAVGCSLHSLNVLQGKAEPGAHTDDHARYVKELGLPLWLAYLEDNIFETLPDEEAMTWPRRFAEAVPVGVVVPDLLLAKILRWTLADAEWGVRNVSDKPDVIAAIDGMAALFDREIAGDSPTAAEWAAAA